MSHVPDFQMNQGFSSVLMLLAKCTGLFQTLNIASNEPACISGVTSRSRISFSGLQESSADCEQTPLASKISLQSDLCKLTSNFRRRRPANWLI